MSWGERLLEGEGGASFARGGQWAVAAEPLERTEEVEGSEPWLWVGIEPTTKWLIPTLSGLYR